MELPLVLHSLLFVLCTQVLNKFDLMMKRDVKSEDWQGFFFFLSKTYINCLPNLVTISLEDLKTFNSKNTNGDLMMAPD